MEFISIAGIWQCRLDKEMAGIAEEYYNQNFDDIITLPGTTSMAGLGEINEKSETGYLTDRHFFEGYAWYAKEIALPEDAAGKNLFLYMERTRVSRVWVDGREVSCANSQSLCSPHVYNLSDYVSSESFRLTVMISNVDYKTRGGHMTSPDTQTNWNGICGQIKLIVCEDEYLQTIRTDADEKTGTLTVTMKWSNLADTTEALKLNFSFEKMYLSDEKIVSEPVTFVGVELTKSIILEAGENVRSASFELGNVEKWSEYNPVIYKVIIKGDDNTYYGEDVFGFRSITTDEHHFYINGTKTFLRGKHDGMVFPLTGAAPTDINSWLKVLSTAKQYGINHYRYHTCTPPDAAFLAADLLGIYMSPELPFWGTIAAPGEDGYNGEEQDYLISEGFLIMESFANHPSFAFMSLGNELWGSQERLNEILARYKAVDGRHLYTQGSNNFQFVPCILENDDYFVGVRFGNGKLIRGSYAMCDAPQGFVQTDKPNTNHDYDMVFAEFGGESDIDGEEIEIQYGTGVKKVRANNTSGLVLNKPVVSHEVGQFAFYPDFKEIKKYTGVLAAKNLEIFKERVNEAGLWDLANDFFISSGKLAASCYKMELEAAHRSKLLAGYQLLDIQDFPGQGTALVGILDAFMDNKGIISAREWRNFCSDAVLMASFEDFCLESGDTFTFDVLLSVYRPELINTEEPLEVKWGIYDRGRVSVDYGDVDEILIASGTLGSVAAEPGVVNFGKVNFDLPATIMPEKLCLKLELLGEDVTNSYELYVFPEKDSFTIYPADINKISIVNNLEDAKRSLNAGKSTILFVETDKEYIEGTYCTDFWNYPMFKSISDWMKKPRPVGTLGACIASDNAALSLFPSEVYSSPQWYNILTGAKLHILDNAPSGLVPIVSVIDNIERNHRLGFLWEAKVSGEKLLVVAKSLNKLLESVEGKQFVKSILCYAATDEFNPCACMSMEEIERLI